MGLWNPVSFECFAAVHTHPPSTTTTRSTPSTTTTTVTTKPIVTSTVAQVPVQQHISGKQLVGSFRLFGSFKLEIYDATIHPQRGPSVRPSVR